MSNSVTLACPILNIWPAQCAVVGGCRLTPIGVKYHRHAYWVGQCAGAGCVYFGFGQGCVHEGAGVCSGCLSF